MRHWCVYLKGKDEKRKSRDETDLCIIMETKERLKKNGIKKYIKWIKKPKSKRQTI